MQLFKNATIIPLKGTMNAFTGGVYTVDGEFVEDSVVARGRPAELQQTVEHLSGTYIYGGCLFRHFGHLIWESLSRLYVIRQYDDYPIIFINPHDEQLDNELHTFFTAIGVKNEIRLAKVQTSVENLIYASPGSSIKPLYINDEQINALQWFNFSASHAGNDVGKKIWVSRSKLLFGTILNEQVIEKILAKIGYTIIYPELLPLQEQVRLLSTADIVAGFDGSAFFSLFFAQEILGKFHIFYRRPSIPDEIPYFFQKIRAQFEIYDFDVEYICGKGSTAYYEHAAPERILAILS